MTGGSTLTVESNGVLIVEGDYITDGGASNLNQGRTVVKQDFIASGGAKVTNSQDFYVFGATTRSGGAKFNGSNNTSASNIQTQSDLQDNDSDLADFSSSGVSTLPISLTYFTAQAQGSKVIINWETAEEINNDFFTIERSGDGRKFEKIATIPGSGNSQRPIAYSFTDPFPLPEISYYRLRQTDFDGQFEVFKAVAVSLEASSETSQAPSISTVAPNPFQSSFRVDFTVATSGTALIQLMNTGGRVVASAEVSVYTGRNQHEFYQADRLQSGIYLLRIVFKGKPSSATRIMKQ